MKSDRSVLRYGQTITERRSILDSYKVDRHFDQNDVDQNEFCILITRLNIRVTICLDCRLLYESFDIRFLLKARLPGIAVPQSGIAIRTEPETESRFEYLYVNLAENHLLS
jgi:hypothetical protein